MAISAPEQYLIELINRARLDPLAEAARHNRALNADLAPGTIAVKAYEPLAPDTRLEDASLFHSEWMLDTDTFSHTGAGGSNPGERMADASYDFTGSWSWAENLAWSGTTGRIDLENIIADQHEGLYLSEGHRKNTFSDKIREIGVAQVRGDFTHEGTTYDSSMVTLNFARTGTDLHLTGVAFRDLDGDGFYSIGEGMGGIGFRTDTGRTDSADAGGYSLAQSPDRTLDVTIDRDGRDIGRIRVDLGDRNAKLDVIETDDGELMLAVSADTTLLSGIDTARLLGIGDLDLTGHGGDNTLFGNSGANTLRGGGGSDWIEGMGGDDAIFGGTGSDTLRGGAGDDLIEGGTGRDTAWGGHGGLGQGDTTVTHADTLLGDDGDDVLMGYAGADRLDGGAGDDILTGGGGRDSFVYTGGADVITDFTDNVDMIELDAALLGGRDADTDDFLDLATRDGGDILVDFGGGDTRRLTGIDDADLLANDLIIL